MATSMVMITLQRKVMSGQDDGWSQHPQKVRPGPGKELLVLVSLPTAFATPPEHRRLSSTQTENKNSWGGDPDHIRVTLQILPFIPLRHRPLFLHLHAAMLRKDAVRSWICSSTMEWSLEFKIDQARGRKTDVSHL